MVAHELLAPGHRVPFADRVSEAFKRHGADSRASAWRERRAGSGGGGAHGYSALERTFLASCLFTGRTVGRALAARL